MSFGISEAKPMNCQRITSEQKKYYDITLVNCCSNLSRNLVGCIEQTEKDMAMQTSPTLIFASRCIGLVFKTRFSVYHSTPRATFFENPGVDTATYESVNCGLLFFRVTPYFPVHRLFLLSPFPQWFAICCVLRSSQEQNSSEEMAVSAHTMGE